MFLGGAQRASVVALTWAVTGAWLASAGCGSRTGLHAPPAADAGLDATLDAALDAPECTSDTDCAGKLACSTGACVAGSCQPGVPTVCDDGDECTRDSCSEISGECEFVSLVRDEDQDGYFGPRPGFSAGEPGSCGDDCDDTSKFAFPGGIEICDGVDNDCNGVVDDNASYLPSGDGDLRISGPALRQAGAGGLVFGDGRYAATYAGQAQHWTNYAQGLSETGGSVPSFPETPLTSVNNDNSAGPVVWTGSVFATVWEDRRDNDYEIYFNRIDPSGKKLGADVRVSSAQGFSLKPALLWNGSQYIVVWQEERISAFALIGRVLSAEGVLQGEEQQFTLPSTEAESPMLAEGDRSLAVVFNRNQGFGRETGFMLLSPELNVVTEPISLDADGAVDPSVVWLGDRFVVAWGRRGVAPGDAIWGATVDEAGNVLRPATQLTSGASFARSHAMLPLGDRVLLVWADDHDGNYELYSKMLSADLEELTPRERITFDGSDSVGPLAAFGAGGDVGVLFDDRRDGAWQTYFTRLQCSAGVAAE